MEEAWPALGCCRRPLSGFYRQPPYCRWSKEIGGDSAAVIQRSDCDVPLWSTSLESPKARRCSASSHGYHFRTNGFPQPEWALTGDNRRLHSEPDQPYLGRITDYSEGIALATLTGEVAFIDVRMEPRRSCGEVGHTGDRARGHRISVQVEQRTWRACELIRIWRYVVLRRRQRPSFAWACGAPIAMKIRLSRRCTIKPAWNGEGCGNSG